MRAVVQGFGSMGGSSARYLARTGARVVGVIDAHGAITNPNGLDVEKLLASRSALGEVDRKALGHDDKQGSRDSWLDIDTDILVPAAVGDVLTVANAGKVKARMVVEAANIPTPHEPHETLFQPRTVVL